METRSKRRKLCQLEISSKKIQKIWKNYKQLKCQNECDPITLEPLSSYEPHNIFKLISSNGKHVTGLYTDTFAEYINETGRILNPLTQVEMNEIELSRLNTQTNGVWDLSLTRLVRVRDHSVQRSHMIEYWTNDIRQQVYNAIMNSSQYRSFDSLESLLQDHQYTLNIIHNIEVGLEYLNSEYDFDTSDMCMDIYLHINHSFHTQQARANCDWASISELLIFFRNLI